MFILAVLSASFYTSPRAIFLRQIISFHFPVQNLVTASHYTEDRSPSPQWGSPSPGLCLPLKLLPLCTCYTPAWSLPPCPRPPHPSDPSLSSYLNGTSSKRSRYKFPLLHLSYHTARVIPSTTLEAPLGQGLCLLCSEKYHQY